MYWFCHTSTCICHRYTRVHHPESPSLLTPCTIPLGHPSAAAPSIQYHALNLSWQLVSFMILYMFQCHSPKSPTLSHRFQKTVVYICVSFVLHSVCNKFGKLSMGHRTGKGQFSFQSQRRAMSKNVQGGMQLCSFPC